MMNYVMRNMDHYRLIIIISLSTRIALSSSSSQVQWRFVPYRNQHNQLTKLAITIPCYSSSSVVSKNLQKYLSLSLFLHIQPKGKGLQQSLHLKIFLTDNQQTNYLTPSTTTLLLYIHYLLSTVTWWYGEGS